MLEKTGFSLLAIAAIAYLVLLVVVSILAFPVGLIALVALSGVALLFIKVLGDRLKNTDDDYYTNNVKQ